MRNQSNTPPIGATDLTDTRKGVSHGGGYVPMRDLYLAQAFEHPASMYGMLFLSASLLAASRSHQGPFTKMLALKHRAKLLGMISSATRKSLCEMGGLVQAIGFQVVHDVRFPFESPSSMLRDPGALWKSRKLPTTLDRYEIDRRYPGWTIRSERRTTSPSHCHIVSCAQVCWL